MITYKMTFTEHNEKELVEELEMDNFKAVKACQDDIKFLTKNDHFEITHQEKNVTELFNPITLSKIKVELI